MTSPVQQWADFMRFTGCATTTVMCRTRTLRRVERELGDPMSLTKSDLMSFLSVYDAAGTRATVLSYLRAFYRWALDEGLRADDPTEKIPSVKVPAGEPRPALQDDVSRLLHTADARTRVMALLMAYAGLRCCEVAAFRREHLAQTIDGRWWVRVPSGKGGKAASVPVPHDIAEQIAAGPFWDLSAQSVQKTVRRALKAAGSEATPHQLRHYYATSALQSTQNLGKVQKMMRHASPTTTARYAQITSQELSEAAEGLPRIA